MGQGRRGDSTILSRGGGEDPPGAAAGVDPGTIVAGYRVEALAGAGGMGVVYRAADPELGRPVALKLIAPRRASDPRFRDLFVRESLIAAGLEHPNVIPIYRAGEDEGRLYIAMRYVEGASLGDLIAERGGLPPGRAARIVARVAEALDAAHARGLVHRDVKPANVLVADPDGEEHVYLTDFGLSVGTSGAREGEPGGWAGTLAYLAPEQVRGGPVDARTDVYALGCVLFNALTGRPPFETHDEAAALEAHLTEAPPRLADAAPGLPPALDDVVRRAMAKRPEDRFQTAGELGRAALAARYDVALLHADADAGAAAKIAARVGEEGLHPFLAPEREPRAAAEGVRASSACAVLVGRGGLGDWARDGLAAAKDLAARDRAFRLVLVLLPGAPDAGAPGLAFLANQPWVDLRAGLDDQHGSEDLVRVLRGADVPPGLMPAAGEDCPYRGLEAFREEDTDLFFGREEDVARLVERLRGTRFLAVLGPSGSGKSSLVAAGLIPAVRRGALPAGESWRVLEMTPGARPLAALAALLARLPGAGAPGLADLAADERGLDLAVARALDGRPAGERALMVVDQLEEAFTLCQDEGERAAFLGNLMYAATIPGGRAVVVVAMRADFYHRLAEHPELRSLVASQQVLLGPLDARGLRRAIEQPAARAGLELEPGLTRRILTDVSDRPGTLPLMEHLLLEVWQRRRGRMLTLEGYTASGGVEGALARRANSIYGAMGPERQAVARRVLLRLTQPGEGTEDTRRRAERRELITRPGEEGEVDAVVAALAEARLVTTGSDEASGQPVVDVTHEALIRGWPELRGWINDDREQLRLHRRLSDAAGEWDGGGRDDGGLFRGAPLAVWEGRDESDLNELERGFLSASRDRVERERATRRRRTRITIGALAVIAAIIAGIAVFAFVQRNEAASQRDTALSRQLAASARTQLVLDPELGLLLARRAYDEAPTAQAEEVLRQATFEARERASFSDHDGRVNDAEYSPDGSTVATAGADGSVRLWAPGSAGPATAIPAHEGGVAAVAWSDDGARLVSGGVDGAVRVWDARGRPLEAFEGHQGSVNDVDFGRGGTRVVSGGDDGTVRLWPLAGGAPRVLEGHAGPVLAVRFDPDGDRLVSGGVDASARIWDLAKGRSRVLKVPTGAVIAVAFSPDGRSVATAGDNRSLQVWSARGGGPALRLSGHETSVNGVAFSHDGRYLVSAGGDDTVRVWKATGGPAVAVLRGHDGVVGSASFGPSGEGVVSASADGTARVWDWSHGLPEELTSVAPLIGVGHVQFATDGRDLVIVPSVGRVTRWNPESGRVDRLDFGSLRSPLAAAITPDAGRIAISSYDGDLVLRDRSDPTVTRPIGTAGIGIDLAYDPAGRLLASGGDDGTMRVWDSTGRRIASLTGHDGAIYAVAIGADGSRAMSGGEDGTIRVWDLAGSTAPALLTGHQGAVISVAISPDGRRVASGGTDRTVRVWSVDGAAPPLVLRGHRASVDSVAFTSDGLVVSAASDGVRVWDPSRGISRLELAGLGAGSLTAVVNADTTRVAAADPDGMVRVWDCEVCGPVGKVVDLAEARATRELTPEEEAAFVVEGS